MVYVLIYAFVQGKAGDYQEMSAAAVAAFFAAIMGLRTIWGLWQLAQFHSWANRSIDALQVFGIKYSLRRMHMQQNNLNPPILNNSSDIADEIFVNETVVDNQVNHGDAQCYLELGDYMLLEGIDHELWQSSFDNRELRKIADTIIMILDPFYFSVLRWIFFPIVVLSHYLRALVLQRSCNKLKQVPKEPIKLWVHWAAVFATQGLENWMQECRVPLDPNIPIRDTDTGAKDRFLERGQCFASQLLASAMLHLWSEHNDAKGISPILWDRWNEHSNMSDGRIVKQDLFRYAVQEGICLPFGAPQDKLFKERGEEYWSYEAYREMLAEFTSNLPVWFSPVKERRKFNVNMLEWLTILLHLGRLSRKLGVADQPDQHRDGASGDSRDASDHEPGSGSNAQDMKSRLIINISTAEGALSNLSSQLGIRKRNYSSSSIGGRGSLFSIDSTPPFSGIPVIGNTMSITSEGNRLVSEVGQLIDVWLSLVSGEQIGFLVENLNGEWKKHCLGREGSCEAEEGRSGLYGRKSLQQVHMDLEMRRLARRIAHQSSHRYNYLDQCVTFMGYRMESVRSVIGRWLNVNTNSWGDDYFGNLKIMEFRLEVGLGEAMLSVVKQFGLKWSLFRRRGLQCQLIWALQRSLEAILLPEQQKEDVNEHDEMRIATIMLFLLSFPGLRVEVGETLKRSDTLPENSRECCIDLDCRGGSWREFVQMVQRKTDYVDLEGPGGHRREGRKRGYVNGNQHGTLNLDFRVMCSPQDIFLRAEIHTSGKCFLNLVQKEKQDFKWKWWRDAFLGRLEGFQAWQNDMGISIVPLHVAKIEDEGRALKEVNTVLDAKVNIWTEWPPFRPQFCRLELETENFLQQPMSTHQDYIFEDESTVTCDISRLRIQDIRPVKYKDARERLLKDSCNLVLEGMMQEKSERIEGEPIASTTIASGNHVEQNGEDSNESNSSGRLIVHQKNALRHGHEEALQQCMGILAREPGERQERVSEAIYLLSSFLGIMLSSNSSENQEERASRAIKVVLRQCRRIIGIFSGRESQKRDLFSILYTCLVMNPAEHGKEVMLLAQQMLAFHNYNESKYLLLKIAKSKLLAEEKWRRTVENDDKQRKEGLYGQRELEQEIYRENNLAALSIVEKLSSRSAEGIWQNEARERDSLVLGMYRLAALLESGAERTPEDVSAAIHLYRRAIDEGSYVPAMNNLAFLLERGAGEVQPDAVEAVQLYKRAIDQGNSVDAMLKLSQLLEKGAQHVPRDPERAMQLQSIAFQQVYSEWEHSRDRLDRNVS
ncbi:Sel1-repeat containing protein [Gracilaria domingensis]|nr:Sel1-repeat containing protein [Gracilaria domingensis]